MSTDFLVHYGIKRRSGRYPWGSGDNPYQHEDFLRSVESLANEGLSEKEIAEKYEMTIQQLRNQRTIARESVRAEEKRRAIKLHEKGYSNTKIADMLKVTEGTIRNYIREGESIKANSINTVADILKKEVDKKGNIDIGSGTAELLGITPTRLNAAVQKLENMGYSVNELRIPQITDNYKKTTTLVLSPPGTDIKEIYKNVDKISYVDPSANYIHSVGGIGSSYIDKDGQVHEIKYPKSIKRKDILVRYKEDGGEEKDGLIEIRRGVNELNMGNSAYAQVRIAVDDKMFMKGMAIYSDDIPEGYNVIYNSNKHAGSPDEKVFKPIEPDPLNPFGALIDRQNYYVDSKGEQKQGALNILREEGDWAQWSKTLSSQMLGKQDVSLIKKQLTLSLDDMKGEFEDIKSITNPTIKKELLIKFGDTCDASAVDLKAKALPRQSTHVILPVPGLKDNEIYAPNYKNGEKVALIRHPHAGIFEIPILTVNNNQPEAVKALGKTPIDAVGINGRTARILSGADFDGDTVLVIPTNSRVHIKNKGNEPLAQLKDFDPHEQYKGYDGMSILKGSSKQQEMGRVSNLITDMTLKGANEDEIARAVKYSMVVIDAEKHKLDYKACYRDNRIGELKAKYQRRVDPETGNVATGASTLLSRSKGPYYVKEREPRFSIDPKTGEKLYKETERMGYTWKIDPKTGKKIYSEKGPKMQESSQMAETKDAFKLSSGTLKENIYAQYANRLKAMGNEARKEALAVKERDYSPSAAKTFSKEVDSLNNKLILAVSNSPKERMAMRIANQLFRAVRNDNPNMTREEESKERGKAINRARAAVGAKKERISITDKEWQAIQAGAITKTKLEKILLNTDIDSIRQKAMPNSVTKLTKGQTMRLRSMAASGNYTLKEIADEFDISLSTVSSIIKGGGN